MTRYKGFKMSYNDINGLYELRKLDGSINSFSSRRDLELWFDGYKEGYKDFPAYTQEEQEAYTEEEIKEWSGAVPMGYELKDYDDEINKQIKTILNPETTKKQCQEAAFTIRKLRFYEYMRRGDYMERYVWNGR